MITLRHLGTPLPNRAPTQPEGFVPVLNPMGAGFPGIKQVGVARTIIKMRHHATRGIARDDTLIANQTGYDLFDQEPNQTLLGSIISCRIGPAAAAELAAWTRPQGAAAGRGTRIEFTTRAVQAFVVVQNHCRGAVPQERVLRDCA
jgi:hypothetical protein